MSDKTTLFRYSYSGDKLELLVKPDPAFDYKSGKLLTSELKEYTIKKLQKFLKEHQKKRVKAKKLLNEFLK